MTTLSPQTESAQVRLFSDPIEIFVGCGNAGSLSVSQQQSGAKKSAILHGVAYLLDERGMYAPSELSDGSSAGVRRVTRLSDETIGILSSKENWKADNQLRKVVYGDPAVRLSREFFQTQAKMRGKPLLFEHGPSRVLGSVRSISVEADSDEVLVTAEVTDPALVEEMKSHDSLSNQSFSIGYDVQKTEGGWDVVGYNLKEVSLVRQPFFDGCHVGIYASKSQERKDGELDVEEKNVPDGGSISHNNEDVDLKGETSGNNGARLDDRADANADMEIENATATEQSRRFQQQQQQQQQQSQQPQQSSQQQSQTPVQEQTGFAEQPDAQLLDEGDNLGAETMEATDDLQSTPIRGRMTKEQIKGQLLAARRELAELQAERERDRQMRERVGHLIQQEEEENMRKVKELSNKLFPGEGNSEGKEKYERFMALYYQNDKSTADVIYENTMKTGGNSQQVNSRDQIPGISQINNANRDNEAFSEKNKINSNQRETADVGEFARSREPSMSAFQFDQNQNQRQQHQQQQQQQQTQRTPSYSTGAQKRRVSEGRLGGTVSSRTTVPNDWESLVQETLSAPEKKQQQQIANKRPRADQQQQQGVFGFKNQQSPSPLSQLDPGGVSQPRQQLVEVSASALIYLEKGASRGLRGTNESLPAVSPMETRVREVDETRSLLKAVQGQQYGYLLDFSQSSVYSSNSGGTISVQASREPTNWGNQLSADAVAQMQYAHRQPYFEGKSPAAMLTIAQIASAARREHAGPESEKISFGAIA